MEHFIFIYAESQSPRNSLHFFQAFWQQGNINSHVYNSVDTHRNLW